MHVNHVYVHAVYEAKPVAPGSGGTSDSGPSEIGTDLSTKDTA